MSKSRKYFRKYTEKNNLKRLPGEAIKNLFYIVEINRYE